MNLSTRPERSVVEEPAVSFCPSDPMASNKCHRPPLCHPERRRGICSLRSWRNRAWRRFTHRTFAVPEVKLQVPRLSPDFLSALVVSVNLMRLSSEKAAYVVVFESSVVGNPEFARDDKGEGGG